MKILKIVLIIVLLVVMCSISFGTGSITYGDKTIDMADIKEMYSSTETSSVNTGSMLNEWFKGLEVTEKMKLYTYWHGLNHNRSEFDDRLIYLEEEAKTLWENSMSHYKKIWWFGLRIDANERWIEEIRKVMGDELPEAIIQIRGGK